MDNYINYILKISSPLERSAWDSVGSNFRLYLLKLKDYDCNSLEEYLYSVDNDYISDIESMIWNYTHEYSKGCELIHKQASPKEKQLFYQSTAWKYTKKLFRYNKKSICNNCGSYSQPQNLHVHHRYPINTIHCRRSYMNVDLSTLSLLCKNCHVEYHIDHRQTQNVLGYDIFEGSDFID